jgi:hypothetical protein
MADTVTSQTLKDSASTWAVKLTNISDGTGETNVTKVTANNLIASTGDASSQRLSITKLFWNVSKGTSSTMDPRVTLFWANSVGGGANTTIATLSGSGVLDLTTGLQAPFTNNAANTAGNILLSTTGFTANAAYTVVLEGKKTAGYTSRETTDDGFTP